MTATTDDAAIARELATRLPEVVAGGDLAAMLPLLSPDVRWGPDGDDTPDTCHSRDDVARWFGGRLRGGACGLAWSGRRCGGPGSCWRSRRPSPKATAASSSWC
jgi:hypothetical protein